MNKKRIHLSLCLIGTFLLAILLSSCDKKPLTPDLPSGNESIVFSTSLVNSDGMSGNGYLQVIGALNNKKYDNSNAIPVGFGTTPIYIGKHVYVLPDYMGNSKAQLTRYSVDVQNKLVREGAMELPAGAAASCVTEASADKAYVSFNMVGKVFAFNPKTMQKIAEIDLNHLKHSNTNVAPGSMRVKEGKLYVGLGQFDPKWMPLHKEAEFAVIDVATDKVEKKISDSTSGLSVATRPIDPNSIFITDNGNLYASCMGSFGFNPEFPGGIIRIKKGETEIDKGWNMRLSDIDIEVSDVVPATKMMKADYIASMYYAGGNTVYAYVGIYALDPDNKDPYRAYYCLPVIIDLVAKTITQIKGMPVSNPHATAIGRYKDSIIFGNTNKHKSGFYRYNPQTKQVDGPVIETQGNPVSFFHLK